MEKKMYINDKKRACFKTLLVLMVIANLLTAFTGCSDVGLEEILDNSAGMYSNTGTYQQSQQDEWTLRSVYFMSKTDTANFEACMTKKTGEEKWRYFSDLHKTQKQEIQAFADYLSDANVDSCTDSTIVIEHLGQYLKAGRCLSVSGSNFPYKVIGVWRLKSD